MEYTDRLSDWDTPPSVESDGARIYRPLRSDVYVRISGTEPNVIWGWARQGEVAALELTWEEGGEASSDFEALCQAKRTCLGPDIEPPA